MLTNCKNCGAPLIREGGVARCEYCGSEFADEPEKRSKYYEAWLRAAQESQTSSLVLAVNATLFRRK